MTNKNLIILTTILLAGIGLIFAKKQISQYQSTKPNDYLKAIKAIAPDKISNIILKDSSTQLQINKEGTEWKVASKSANVAMVEDLINGVIIDSSPLLIGESEELKKKQGLTEQEAIKITIKSNNQELTLNIGPKNGSFNPIQIDGTNQIYSLRGLPNISTDANKWVNLKIVDIDSSQIKSLTFNTSWQPFTIQKQEDKSWKFSEGEDKVNQDEVEQFLLDINPFKAKELAYEQKQEEYNLAAAAEFYLTIVTDDDQSQTLEFYPGKNDYLIKRTPDVEYFIGTNYDAEDFKKLKGNFVMSEVE